jgi:hypothetical protein
MNNTQRKAIQILANKIDNAKDDGMPLPELQALVKGVVAELESIRDEEQNKFDNMPEGLQSSSKGTDIEDAIQLLDDAISDLDSIDNAEEGEEDEVGSVLDAAIDNMRAV